MNKQKAFLISFLAVMALVVSGCTISIGGGGSTAVDGGVWKSSDSGKTWNQVVVVPTASGKAASIANVDIRRMIFDPEDYNTIYLATENDGVIYTNDGGANWRQFNQFVGAKIRAVAVDPNNKCNLYVLVANKLYKSTDCGRFWADVYFHQNIDVVLTDIIVDYHNGSVVYMTTSAGEVLKSTNAGLAWTTVQRVDGGVFSDLIMDAKDSNVVYAATQKSGVFKTIDGGANWNSLGSGLASYSGSQEYKSLIIDPATAGSLILVSKFGMLRTRDGGANWSVVDLLPASQKTTIYSAAVNPKDSNEIYYATKTTLVKSTDGGKTWSSQALPFSRVANRIIINPETPTVVYIATSNSVK